MAFIPFKKSNKCVVTDNLFLEMSWIDGKSPDDDSELLGIIEGLDQQYLDTFEHTIEESLPYVTFFQAELLFKELQDVYGQFQLKKVAICHLEGKEAVSEGEVFTSPFIINQGYQNLLFPLIQSIMSEPEFKSYTYQEKREYFVNQVYPEYKASMGIRESALPLFPEEGELVSTVIPQQSHRLEATEDTSTSRKVVEKVTKETSLQKIYLLMGVLAFLTITSGILSVSSYMQVSKQKEQVTYLYKELKDNQILANKEHQIDVFSRYFLPNYYSGQKDNLGDFLSDGDAKYTIPKEGTLQSVILENLSYDSKTKEYTVTYILSVKKEDKATSTRLSFTVKESNSSKYGYVVTTEPKESDYVK